MSFPKPGPNDVSIAWVDVSSVTAEDTRRGLAILSTTEQERFARYRHPLTASQFVVGRLLIRRWLEFLTGEPASRVKLIEGIRGRPALEDHTSPWSFNVAHSAGLVACAMSRLTDVGVDLEHLDRRPLVRELYRRFCSPMEMADIEARPESERMRRFLTYWTLKEAYLKARGLGIAVHLADIEFSLAGAHPSIGFRGSLEGTDPGWAFELFEPAPRCLLSAAAPHAPGTLRPRFDVHAEAMTSLTLTPP